MLICKEFNLVIKEAKFYNQTNLGKFLKKIYA